MFQALITWQFRSICRYWLKTLETATIPCGSTVDLYANPATINFIVTIAFNSSFKPIREDVNSVVYVENLTEECVSTMKDVTTFNEGKKADRNQNLKRIEVDLRILKLQIDYNFDGFGDESNEELELYVVLQVIMQELYALCVVSYIAIEIVLKRYIHKYPRIVIRGPNRLQEQMDHINRLVRESDITYIEQFRMDRHCFMMLCHMVHTIGGLGHSKNVTLEEKMALFLYVLAHDLNVRKLKFDFFRFEETDRAIGDFAEGLANAVDAINAEEELLFNSLADDGTFLEYMGMNSHIEEGINCSSSLSQ
ncbi:hypothetical protein LOK49_LG09G00838 [Camellia lanceoleosa]|uniref:Uncharacterized protein n=1 Tax=Camellia lanceoleosa TaxID=1840588 RepID=A0ACC0GIM8_9ERIC|nr:hypothetical protein LOK49_LG09G00838 [Camellia lanceoleosa]